VKVKSITAVISCSHFFLRTIFFQLVKTNFFLSLLSSLFSQKYFGEYQRWWELTIFSPETKKKKNRNNVYRWWAFYFRDRDPGSPSNIFSGLVALSSFWDPFKLLAVAVAFLSFFRCLATWHHEQNVWVPCLFDWPPCPLCSACYVRVCVCVGKKGIKVKSQRWSFFSFSSLG